jgi:hypothetical protein
MIMTNNTKAKIIAIDYDGTIALNSYPEAGNPNWPVIDRAKKEQANGARLILWTCREGKELATAIEACAEWGLLFEAVNDNPLSRQILWGNNPRKIYADEYWDDHAKEVKYGHWKYYSTTMMECSICKRHVARHRFSYCPHCGAKMNLEV